MTPGQGNRNLWPLLTSLESCLAYSVFPIRQTPQQQGGNLRELVQSVEDVCNPRSIWTLALLQRLRFREASIHMDA